MTEHGQNRALVIGYGAIGRRHARLLAEAGMSVRLVTGQADVDLPAYPTVAAAFAESAFDLVVIANAAAMHLPTLRAVGEHRHGGRLLLEKPLADRKPEGPVGIAGVLRVGYNLRFSPLFVRLNELVAGRRLLSICAYVGQYLPDWRPGRDHRTTASAARAAGGGALRELSHELDMCTVLAGSWRRVAAIGGSHGTLGIDADDQFGLLVEAERCPLVQMTLNMLDRAAARWMVVNADGLSVHVDFRAGTIVAAGEITSTESIIVDPDHTYKEQLRDLLGEARMGCTWEQAVEVMSLVEAAEASAAAGRWVAR